MNEGVAVSEYYEYYRDIFDKHIGNGLLFIENGRIKLTKKGVDISNSVLCDFV
jgi:oxygen-independent coproporphyrinogen-3 oxidase